MHRVIVILLVLVWIIASSEHSWSSRTPPSSVRLTNYHQLNYEEQDNAPLNSQLPAPHLLSPDSGSSYRHFQPWRFTWATSLDVNDDKYLFQMSFDSTFSNSGGDYTTQNFVEFIFVRRPDDGKYFWRVKAYNLASTDSSAWSPVWFFVQDSTSPYYPTLLLPVNGYYSAGWPLTFRWANSYVTDSLTFRLELSTNREFVGGDTRTYNTGEVSMLDLLEPLLSDSVYYWRVRAVDIVGNSSVSASRTIYTFQLSDVCGDVNNSGGSPNVVDITYLVQWLFVGGPPPPFMPAANVNGAPPVNIVDLTTLVQFLFMSGPPLNCQ